MLYTTNGAGLRSSAASEAFLIDAALIPSPPIAMISDSNGTTPLSTVSNLTLNVVWDMDLRWEGDCRLTDKQPHHIAPHGYTHLSPLTSNLEPRTSQLHYCLASPTHHTHFHPPPPLSLSPAHHSASDDEEDIDYFAYNLTNASNATSLLSGTAPLAPTERFTFRVFVRRNGTPAVVLTQAAPVECLPYVGASNFLAEPVTTSCRFGGPSHFCCLDTSPDTDVVHDALLSPRLAHGTSQSTRHVRQLSPLNDSVVVMPTAEGVGFLHHESLNVGEARRAVTVPWTQLAKGLNCTGDELGNASIGAASDLWAVHACGGSVQIYNTSLHAADAASALVGNVPFLPLNGSSDSSDSSDSSSSSEIVQLAMASEVVASWVASEVDRVAEVRIASIGAAAVVTPFPLFNSSTVLPSGAPLAARELCVSCLATDGTILAHGWFHSSTGASSCDNGGGVGVYDRSGGANGGWVRRALLSGFASALFEHGYEPAAPSSSADSSGGCSFGRVVEVAGNVLAVGIPEGNGGAGRVAIYDLSVVSDPTLACVLSPPPGATSFGSSLSIRVDSGAKLSLAIGMSASEEYTAAGGNATFTSVHQLSFEANLGGNGGDGRLSCASAATRSSAPDVLRLSSASLVLSNHGVVAAVMKGALNETSLSITTYCQPNFVKAPSADYKTLATKGYPYRAGYAFACVPCPDGQTSVGGATRICVDCSEMQCIPSGQRTFQAYVNVQDVPNSPGNGDSLSVQVVARRGAAASAPQVANTSLVLYDATPPTVGEVKDAMPCGCILPNRAFATVNFTEGGRFSCDSRLVSYIPMVSLIRARRCYGRCSARCSRPRAWSAYLSSALASPRVMLSW